MDPVSFLAFFGPLVSELGKAAIGRIFGQENFKPATITDWVTMQKTQVDMFNAVNNAGGNNPSYLWVEAIIRLMRPAIALIVTMVWAYVYAFKVIDDKETLTLINSVANSVWFYLFGERSLTHIRNAASKATGATK